MGILDKFKNGLRKTRNFVSESINRIGASIGRFDEDMLTELEAVLIQADLGVPATMRIMDEVRRDIKESGDATREAVLGCIRRSILAILGEKRQLELDKENLNILLLVGVNGTGKTTTAGKLCAMFHTQGRKVVLGAADTFRAAAIEQVSLWGERTNTPVIAHETGSDPAAVVFDAVNAAKARKADVLILDTAGRLHNKKNLMEELNKIRRVIQRTAPEAKCETILVIDATTGQNAVMQAKAFQDVADVTGLAITKLDGNSKGGVAVAVAHETRTPIFLAGLGEKPDDLADFDPEAFVASLLPD